MVLCPFKIQCGGIMLKNLWWSTVWITELQVYYTKSGFIAGDKYSFITFEGTFCWCKPSSNYLVAGPIVSIIFFFNVQTFPAEMLFSPELSLQLLKIQQHKSRLIYKLISNDPFNKRFFSFTFFASFINEPSVYELMCHSNQMQCLIRKEAWTNYM